MVLEYMRQTTARAGSFFVDLTDPFGGLNEDAYTDYCHLTPVANRRLAEYLGEKVLPLIRGKSQVSDSSSIVQSRSEIEPGKRGGVNDNRKTDGHL